MVKLHFQNYLNKARLEEIKTEYGFRESLPLEKFIMNFEVLAHIQEVLPDCVVKGGMAVPFHLRDKALRRLSVDIDIVTGRSRDEVIDAMKSVSKKLLGTVKIGDCHNPKSHDSKMLPLLTYFCAYTSSVDENPEIKIEIFYEHNMDIPFKKIEAGIEMVGFSMDFPLSVYDHGYLIGDKLTTLPSNTIGIGPERELDVPKQIYDVASLLKAIPHDPPMEMILDAFQKISMEELSYFKEKPPTFDDVLDDFEIFSNSLLITDNQIKLNPSYQGRFEKFTTEMLGNVRYSGYVHVTDILLVKVIVKLISKRFNGTSLGFVNEVAGRVLVGLDNFSSMTLPERTAESKKLVRKYGKNSDEGKIMKNLFPEQVFLYDKLIEIDAS